MTGLSPSQHDGCRHGVIIGCPRADGRWLLIRRSGSVAAAAGRVCFPGGHVERGESSRQAAIREMREELGVEVELVRQVWRRHLPQRRLVLDGWLGRLASTAPMRPAPAEVAEILWLTGAEAAGHPDGLTDTADFVAALEAARSTVISTPHSPPRTDTIGDAQDADGGHPHTPSTANGSPHLP